MVVSVPGPGSRAVCSSVAWSWSQRRHTLWSGRRDATSAQNAGPWPKISRWASSWITTVSRASGGASTSRHEKDNRPVREALPHRDRGSRKVIAAGVTPSAGAWSRIAASIAALASLRSQVSRIAASGRRSRATRWMTSTSSKQATSDRRTPDTAGTTRMSMSRPRNGISPPSRAPARVASRATRSAWSARWRRTHGSRSPRNATARCSPAARAARVAGTVTMTPRSGWMTTRRPRARGECRRVYGTGPPGRWATTWRSSTPDIRALIRGAAGGRRARRSRRRRAPPGVR